MSRFVMKVERDDSDWYAVWSTGVDSWIFQGTRAEVEQYFVDRAIEDAKRDNAERFKIIEQFGTSVSARYGSGPLDGGWDDDLIVMSPMNDESAPGTLKRADLGRWLKSGDDSLLTPFPDDE